MVTRSDRLDHVHSDIRGPLYQEALRMESEGINVLKLNTGNPGRFGFKLPNSVRQALALPLAGAFWPRLAALGAGGCATAGVFLLAAWPLGLGEELARMRGTI